MSKYGRGFLWTIGILAALVLGLRAFVLDVWTIPEDPVLSASIAPTLTGGDVVLVLTRGTPGFGELVRCPDPEDPQHFVVGRIAGLEGDTVETEGGSLLVNGKRYDGETVCKSPKISVRDPSSGNEVQIPCDVVSMGGGWHYRAHGGRPFKVVHTRTDVGGDMVFLLSDDREYHDDSRDFGVITRAVCKQRILFRLWSKAGWSDDENRMDYIH